MSIDRNDFDSIEEADLQELIDAQVPEGLRIEYKLTKYGNNDASKKELLSMGWEIEHFVEDQSPFVGVFD